MGAFFWADFRNGFMELELLFCFSETCSLQVKNESI